MPSKKKKYNSRFPPARIKKIMQTDEEVGKVAAAVPVIISRALELFIESLITKSSETTISKNAKTLTTSHIKQTIHSEKKFDFLRDLVATIPDHQAEEELGVGEGGGLTVEAKPVRKPRVVRPRKQKDGTVQKRRRKKKDESESSEEPEESEEETEEEEEELEGNGESAQALAGPSTSQQTFAVPPPPQPSPAVPPQPPLGIFYPRMPVPNNSGVPAAAATLSMPSSTPNQGLAEDDDYDDV